MKQKKYVRIKKDKLLQTLTVYSVLSHSIQDWQVIIKEFNSLSPSQRNAIIKEEEFIHVIDHGDISVAPLVAGFVNADATNIIMNPCGNIWFQALMGSFDAVSDSAPVYALKLTDSGLVHLTCEPCDLIVEGCCKAAGPIRPGDRFIECSMLWAEDTLRLVQDINRNPVKARSSRNFPHLACDRL